ncbi:hypothetical protein PFICI_06393 [Pestalotiopsis fici W106-1]|uniref:Uncharacterized protein n=1 Tax=Pestalotiopsis fici (strain W106-1 / CGMCC3.15140) TaxID=1229662 RepID=W3X877_PESFW|nr:uncharacterized protein PFICI_06393 [Pestalotiopsis fici W106-1]ETS81391.1 hypothetical protein PFICI_06393 [Pestalotiopsis fici W106-1]
MRLLLLLFSQILLALAEENEAVEMAAMEAPAALNNGFSPRLFEGAVAPVPFAKRQDLGVCPDGGHRCEDIGAPDSCCPSDLYCYYKADWEVGCCGFGKNCDPTCTGTLYRVNATITSTASITASITQSGTDTGAATLTETVTKRVTTFTSVGCTQRPCAISEYQCPESMGHGCCNNNQVCGSSARCLGTVSTIATDVPTRGCSGTPSATECTDGGCCLKGQTCANSSGTPVCSGQADGPAGSNTTTVDTGLSQSARAGIGAGVAIGAALVIGAVTWFCIRRRRRAPTDGARTRTGGGGVTPGLDGATAAGGTMSEASVPVRNRVHRHGMVYEYLGPTAVPGPFTEEEGAPVHYGGETHRDRGVPEYPQEPGDISRPVEIGSSPEIIKDKDETLPGFGRSASLRSDHDNNPQATENNEIYELDAFPSPSPMSPEEFASAHSHPLGSPSDFISPPGTLRNDYLG